MGILSALKNKGTNKDYLLAGQNISPWLAGLSAVATNNSGYMFIGMIGFTYTVGLSSMWLMIGWVFGDFIASLFIHKRLRIVTEKQKVLSFSGVLSQWNGQDYRILRLIGGVVTVIFLGLYAAAQLKAGSKSLHVLLGWDYAMGALIGSAIVLAYCFAGGIRASIWTDAAQSIVMIASMALLLFVSIGALGGFSTFVDSLKHVSPTYLDLFQPDLPFGHFWGPFLFVLGWFFAGFGVVGQPHIMVRFMAMDRPKDITRVRLYYYGFYAIFSALTICTGLAARLLLPDTGGFDAELALPHLASQILPQILVGVILAGLFAATISTADSQILSCTASLTRDFSFGKKPSYFFTKLSTVFVTLIALCFALFANENVFGLVLIAWSALACAFAPLFIVYVSGGKPSESLAIAMMLTGLGVVMLWRYLGYNKYFYEVAPGMIAGLVVYVVWSCVGSFFKPVEQSRGS